MKGKGKWRVRWDISAKCGRSKSSMIGIHQNVRKGEREKD
jgi:hypothetical protein